MANRRKHSKVETLPPEIVAAVNQALTGHHTYEEIAAWLREMGHGVSKSSVGRYGKDFLSRLERLKVVRDQARAIVDADPDAPATEMAEAANQLALQMIMELLIKLPEDALEKASVTEVLKALGRLEQSGVAREKLKLTYRDKVEKVAEKVEETGKAKGLDEETIRIIKEQVYGIL